MDTQESMESGIGAPIAAHPTVPQVQEFPQPVMEEVATTAIVSVEQPAQEAVPSGTLAQLTGYLNIGVGLVLLVILGLYAAGFGVWVTHLHVTHRDEGIHWMEQAVTSLFWLVVLLVVLRFVQHNTKLALQLLAVGVILFGGWFVISAIQASGGDDEHH